MQRRYLTENIINCRDLGGYPASHGITAYGKVLRCGIPKAPTAADVAFLKEYGIKTIIDLRGEKEASESPTFLDSDPSFDCYHVPLFDANPAFFKKYDNMSDIYLLSLENFYENYAKALRVIISTDEPLLFHCFAGKDRTGLLAMLLLMTAGVCREDVTADYQVSATFIKPFIIKELEADSGLIWEPDMKKHESPPDYIERAMDFVEKKYGGATGFLSHSGLSDEEIARVSRVLF